MTLLRPVENVILHELFIKFTNIIFKAHDPNVVNLLVPNHLRTLILCHFISFLGAPKIFSKANPYRGDSTMFPNSVETCAIPHFKCLSLTPYPIYLKKSF